jgi:hypothetical protein
MLAVQALPMRKWIRRPLIFIGALSLFILGFGLGIEAANKRAMLWPDIYAAADAKLLREFLVAQSTRGTPGQHEQALRSFLAMLKRQDVLT